MPFQASLARSREARRDGRRAPRRVGHALALAGLTGGTSCVALLVAIGVGWMIAGLDALVRARIAGT